MGPDIIARGKHLDNRRDVPAIFVKALGGLPVVQYLAGDLGVKPPQGA